MEALKGIVKRRAEQEKIRQSRNTDQYVESVVSMHIYLSIVKQNMAWINERKNIVGRKNKNRKHNILDISEFGIKKRLFFFSFEIFCKSQSPDKGKTGHRGYSKSEPTGYRWKILP